jgi:tetratricopeptide (TPR) repeat protein
MKFRQALVLDPGLELDPAAEAAQLAERTAQNLVDGGLDLARQGDLPGALANFQQAQKLDAHFEISGEQWHNLCIEGSQHDQAEVALEACNQAIEFEPGNGLYYNSRGLVRAMTGDRVGAAADFKVFREWLEKSQPEE